MMKLKQVTDEIGYVCSRDHYQFHADPEGSSDCGPHRVGTIQVVWDEELPEDEIASLKHVADEGLKRVIHGWRTGIEESNLRGLVRHSRMSALSADAMYDNPVSSAYWGTATEGMKILMGSPMFDLPEHFPIGVDKDGSGPILPDEPGYDRVACWCGDNTCEKHEADRLT